MAIHQHAGNRALLHVIAAILSLLLLAGLFGSGMDADDDEPGTPSGNAEGGRSAADFHDMP